jgi:hypothetical protein
LTKAIVKFHTQNISKPKKRTWTDYLYDESGNRRTEAEARLQYQNHLNSRGSRSVSISQISNYSKIIRRLEDGFEGLPLLFATFTFARETSNNLDNLVGSSKLKELYQDGATPAQIDAYVAGAKEANPD